MSRRWRFASSILWKTSLAEMLLPRDHMRYVWSDDQTLDISPLVIRRADLFDPKAH